MKYYKIKNYLYILLFVLVIISLTMFCFVNLENGFLFNFSRCLFFVSVFLILIQFLTFDIFIPLKYSSFIKKLLFDKNYIKAYEVVNNFKKLNNINFQILYLSTLVFCGKFDEFLDGYFKLNIKTKKYLEYYKMLVDFLRDNEINLDFELLNKNININLYYKVKYVITQNYDRARNKNILTCFELEKLVSLTCDKIVKQHFNEDIQIINEEIMNIKTNLQIG